MSRSIVVKSNESIHRIAARMYGRWELWRLILDSNPNVSDWKILESGLVLEIPDPKTDDSFHTITLGDSYESLSELYYSTEHFTNLIRSANGNIALYENIGVEIIIPKLITTSELELAQKRMKI